MLASMLVTIILLIVTPAWFLFAVASAWKRLYKRALLEVTIGLAFAAVMMLAFATWKGSM